MKNLDTLYTDGTCYDSAIVGYDCPCQGWGINRELKIRYKPGFGQLLETIPFSEKIYLLCQISISSIADEVYLLLPMKYILEISDSFYARDNECKHSLSSRLTKELEISDSFYARDNECKHSLSSRLTKEFFEK